MADRTRFEERTRVDECLQQVMIGLVIPFKRNPLLRPMVAALTPTPSCLTTNHMDSNSQSPDYGSKTEPSGHHLPISSETDARRHNVPPFILQSLAREFRVRIFLQVRWMRTGSTRSTARGNFGIRRQVKSCCVIRVYLKNLPISSENLQQTVCYTVVKPIFDRVYKIFTPDYAYECDIHDHLRSGNCQNCLESTSRGSDIRILRVFGNIRSIPITFQTKQLKRSSLEVVLRTQQIFNEGIPSHISTGRRGGIHPLNPALMMSPRLVMKRLQSNCQARRTDQQSTSGSMPNRLADSPLLAERLSVQRPTGRIDGSGFNMHKRHRFTAEEFLPVVNSEAESSQKVDPSNWSFYINNGESAETCLLNPGPSLMGFRLYYSSRIISRLRTSLVTVASTSTPKNELATLLPPTKQRICPIGRTYDHPIRLPTEVVRVPRSSEKHSSTTLKSVGQRTCYCSPIDSGAFTQLAPPMRTYLPHLPKSSADETVAATTTVRQVHGFLQLMTMMTFTRLFSEYSETRRPPPLETVMQPADRFISGFVQVICTAAVRLPLKFRSEAVYSLLNVRKAGIKDEVNDKNIVVARCWGYKPPTCGK
ncbi:hypothetical protein CLF_111317 [Clonorchis sinensis]|uniref:Uncharacterized protein n=1 Tax=Clonorchis sinensis TaxID=79923 RepID=G7YLM2_CLOSI|nr:hypothetical protein CLF_111317 [Clonorchis sinensis]